MKGPRGSQDDPETFQEGPKTTPPESREDFKLALLEFAASMSVAGTGTQVAPFHGLPLLQRNGGLRWGLPS